MPRVRAAQGLRLALSFALRQNRRNREMRTSNCVIGVAGLMVLLLSDSAHAAIAGLERVATDYLE